MLELFIEALFIFVVVGFFLSGLDDLYIDVRFFLEKLKDLTDFIPYSSEIESKEEQPIAVLIPAWRENEVIEEMVRHNLRQIDYAKYDLFLGVYPNDTPTQERAEILLRRYPHVYAAVLPHDGPTNKADCLNWIYRKMEEVENREKRQYEIIIIHDAEDLIHPKAFKVINAFIPAYDMIQIPIFSLEVPLHKFTAGTYCDEFAEFHLKDIFVRSRIGGFVPSAGVGTGFSRRAFEIIRTRYQGKIFDPHSLTEDYEIGFKFKQSGLSQTFIPCSIKQRRSPQQLRHYPTLLRPLFMEYHDIIATREYFPFRLWDAIRQKTRWIIGIVFQGTKHIGWRGSKEDLYFLLRDRKGAVTHLITFFGNLLFLFGMIVLSLNWLGWGKIDLLQFIPSYSWFWILIVFNTFMVFERFMQRAYSLYILYDLKQSLLGIIRIPWLNLINFCATLLAAYRYGRAQILKMPLAWAKTSHTFPTYEELRAYRRRLGELLLENRLITQVQLADALEIQSRAKIRIGELLIRLGYITEEDFLRVFAQQQDMEWERVRGELEFDDSIFSYASPQNLIKLGFIPIRRKENIVEVGVLTPPDIERLERIGDLLSGKAVPKLLGKRDYLGALEEYKRAYIEWIRGKVRLGEKLIEIGVIKEEDLWEALSEQRKTGKKLAQILYERGLVSVKDLDRTFRKLYGVRFRPVSVEWVVAHRITEIPVELLFKYHLIPYRDERGRTVMAMSGPIDNKVWRDIQRYHSELEVLFSFPNQITEALRLIRVKGEKS